ncbi:MAG: cytidine deaminase [Treponema sp.]|jgi:cytidine deaminase|nr:cytidine deaminase [Treponema sp.]
MNDSTKMDKLFLEAQNMAKMAYAPYSKFRVGAALLCKDGSIVTGVNVENRSFGLTTCAERNAVSTAIAMGQRHFLALAVCTPDSEEPVGPCGACRQVLSEFMIPDTPVRFAGSGQNQVNTTIGELYPFDSLHELAGIH